MGQYHVRVNTLCTCGVNTPKSLTAWSPKQLEITLSTVPLGQWAEVADALALLSFFGKFRHTMYDGRSH
jgi:hypothetical protein